MRFSFSLSQLICIAGMASVLGVFAQTANSSEEELTALQDQRAVIAQEKKQILDQFQTASKACWKKFAVNDCLAQARRQKYQDLGPLEQREIQLNARQRQLKEIERLERLSDKAANKGNS